MGQTPPVAASAAAHRQVHARGGAGACACVRVSVSVVEGPSGHEEAAVQHLAERGPTLTSLGSLSTWPLCEGPERQFRGRPCGFFLRCAEKGERYRAAFESQFSPGQKLPFLL